MHARRLPLKLADDSTSIQMREHAISVGRERFDICLNEPDAGEFAKRTTSHESPAGHNNLVQVHWAEPASVTAGLKPGQQGGRFTIRSSIANYRGSTSPEAGARWPP